MTEASTSWNPLDPALAEDPYPRYRALREADPVYFEEALGWWFVTGHEEGTRVLREPGGELRFVEFQKMRMGRDVSEEAYCKGLRRFVFAVGQEDHKRIRGTFKRHFTPKRVAAVREELIEVANDLIDEIEPQGSAELLEAYASKLPLSSVSKMLDIPEAEHERLVANLSHFKRAVQFLPMDDEALAKANASIAGLAEHFTEIVARRREDLGDDLLSQLIREADAGALSEEELIANAWGLFAGGVDTTGAATAVGISVLFEHPDQLDRIREDVSLVPNAVDELLRFCGPVQAQHRIFDHEVELGGHTIPPDTPIVTYLIAASRDPRWLEQADELDTVRKCPANHLAFGDGKHKCPGRHLARATMEVAVETLITRLDDLHLDGPVEWDTENLPAIIPSRVPIAWSPRPGG